MQAIILAAGMGKRLKNLTRDNTKCMVEVNGVTLASRLLHQLDACSLSRIVVVTGFKGEKLVDYIASLNIKTPIVYVENPIYDRTNNIYSLALAKDWLLKEDTLLLESDLIFEDSVIRAILDDPRDTLALVDKFESWMDGTCVKLGKDDCIEAFVPGKHFVCSDIPDYYKTVNIYKFSRSFSETHYVPFLEAYSKALGTNEYYEQVLRVITLLEKPGISAKRLDGHHLWYEIDDIQDLDIASSIFAKTDEDKLKSIEKRYGGYWRYPHMTDFCYLVNPYYPPQRMIDEIKSNFTELLTRYPSGMSVNSLLAAKNFGVRQEYILAGNGAAELIKALMEKTEGKTGFIRPTFEEYPSRFPKERSICFVPQAENFAYTADDIISFFTLNPVNTLILINPDNPSGSYIPKKDVLRLAEWCRQNSIRLVVDESFADFADEPFTLLDDELLERFPGLVVIKSVSKSYGVPGLRLGIMASADKELIEFVKKDVSIWNINSFAEFYLQIAEKYKKDYQEALEQFRMARAEFIEGLKKIASIRVFPTQANYVFAEIINGYSSRKLAARLLCEHNIFIKDLSSKINRDNRQFIRIAIRSASDNARLLYALKTIFQE